MVDFVEVNLNFIVRQIEVQRVGSTYKLKSIRKCNNEQIECGKKVQNNVLSENFGVDLEYLKSLNPKEWKDQDHYSVLGLSSLRFNATEDDIRRAYRKMVLQHHPDKRKAKGEEIKPEDDYFTCITKAYEILGTTKTRRAYDSVDPQFDDSLPTQTEIENNFFKSFNKYFNTNARWSEKKNVPSFGDDNSKREEVDSFYTFWYDFKSWREFSYLDEEDKEKGQDRDERRWIEKENKVARIKRKKEEMTRIRTLVDLAYNNDKRILKFKTEEKEKKLAAKRAKMDAAQAQKAEQERSMREAQLAKERADKAEQKRIEQIRIEKEQMKKLLKKERKIFRDKVKECKYFSSNDKDMLKNMEGVEKICEIFTLNELQQLNKLIEKSGNDAFVSALNQANNKIISEEEELNAPQQIRSLKPKDTKETKKNDIWNNENIQILIKAVNLFPAGTSQRWDVIATFINQHANNGVNVNARDVLSKAKALQNSDFSKNSLKVQANSTAFENFEKSKKDVQTCSDITVNTESNALNNSAPNQEKCDDATKNTKTVSSSKTWTKEEQALLEQAIKTYPISTPDRWDRIAECIPNRNKKDCLRRVKELVELVNSKKEAQQAVK